MSFVLDCSVSMAWCFEDEKTDKTEQYFDRMIKEEVFVPSLWVLEVSNVLLGAQRKGHMSAVKAQELIHRFRALPIHIAPEQSKDDWIEIHQLAMQHQLTSYDAAYLALAIKRQLPLATLDRDLLKAAKKLNLAF